MSLRDDILANRQFPVSPPIKVEGWGNLAETLHVRTLTAKEHGKVDSLIAAQTWDDMRGLFAVMALCDKDGKRLFTDDDIPMLSAMPGDPLSTVAMEAKKWNKMTEDDDKAAEGNSTAPASDSGGASPENGANSTPTSCGTS